jgi:hypothetical protein
MRFKQQEGRQKRTVQEVGWGFSSTHICSDLVADLVESLLETFFNDHPVKVAWEEHFLVLR